MKPVTFGNSYEMNTENYKTFASSVYRLKSHVTRICCILVIKLISVFYFD